MTALRQESDPTPDPADLRAALADARPWAVRGLQEARRISHPLLRERYLRAWAYRWTAVDPAEAGPLAASLELGPEGLRDVLRTQIRDRLHLGLSADAELETLLCLPECACPSEETNFVNEASELLLESGERVSNPRMGDLLSRLSRRAESLAERSPSDGALAAALVAETASLLDRPEAGDLLRRAMASVEDAGQPDPLWAFLAGIEAAGNLPAALSLLERIRDPLQRLESRLDLLARARGAEVPGDLLDQVRAEVEEVSEALGPEVLVRAGESLAPLAAELGRGLLRRAWEAGESLPPQLRALHWTGIATLVARFDREEGRRLFGQACEAAGCETERSKRLPTLLLVANEMAEPFPREAADLLAGVVDEGESVDTTWELVHLIELVLRPDRSPYLDVSPVARLIQRVAGRIQDSEPRIPGVIGLPELASWARLVDRDLAENLSERAFCSAEKLGDTDAMTRAALAVAGDDPERAVAWLEATAGLLRRRIDCPAMGEFSRCAGGIVPGLVAGLAPLIPDARERADALTSAAVGLLRDRPQEAAEIIAQLPDSAARSLGYMRLFDAAAGTMNRPLPEPLIEDLP